MVSNGSAPFCNTSIQPPLADPFRKGFQTIPPNATLPQVIRIFNYNFGLMGRTGQNGQPGKPGKNAQEGNFSEVSRVAFKVRVYHMDDSGAIDKSQFIDFVRINQLTLGDHTGQTWVWNRGTADDGPNIKVLGPA